jgi:acetyl esterase/lipase
MRGMLIALAVTLSALSGCTQVAEQPAPPPTPSPTEIGLWPDDLEIARPPVTGEERSFATDPDELVAGRTWTVLENVTRPMMTVYPAQGENSRAAVVVFPGGGYRILAIDLEGTEVCDWLTQRGVTCVLLKYRVPRSGHGYDPECRCGRAPPVPMALQDAQRAMGILRQRAAEFGVDPNRIGVLGFSAGGHLVTAVSNIPTRAYARVDAADDLSSRPDFAIALYPGHLWRDGGALSVRMDTGTPFTVSDQTPPTFIVQAQDDPVDDVRHALTYYMALREANVPTEMHLYATGGHGFGVRRTEAPITEWPALAETWMQTIGVLPAAGE